MLLCVCVVCTLLLCFIVCTRLFRSYRWLCILFLDLCYTHIWHSLQFWGQSMGICMCVCGSNGCLYRISLRHFHFVSSLEWEIRTDTQYLVHVPNIKVLTHAYIENTVLSFNKLTEFYWTVLFVVLVDFFCVGLRDKSLRLKSTQQ